jgi:hypothetical protein
MKPQKSGTPVRYFAAIAALLLCHGILRAQTASANSYLTPSPPPKLTTNDSQCHNNTTPNTPIPDTLGMNYTCYDPKALPENEISPGVNAFNYVVASYGVISAATDGVCMSEYPGIKNSSFPVDPESFTYRQPTYLEVQIGDNLPTDYCNGSVTFKAGTTVTWPGGSITLEASLTTPKCYASYGMTTWTQTDSCANHPASVGCPGGMVGEGSYCACPTGTLWESSSDSCVASCSGEPCECAEGTAVCSNGEWGCSEGYPCCGQEPNPCCDDCYEQCGPSGWECIGSPIILDPTGQGFHLTTLDRGVQFDMHPGMPMQVSWTDNAFNNAFLALDRNGNGTIDSGAELFGNFTPQPAPSSGEHRNGYAALAVFDDPANGGNGNGKIDPGDAIYSSLRLWVDKNHNGISEPDELIPLAAAGVFAIDLNYVELSRFDRLGNLFHYRANVEDNAGQADPRCYDVYLQLKPIRK